MLQEILNRNDIKSFIKMMTTQQVYINKDIPNRISNEKISGVEYSTYIFIDAIVKYFIIINDIKLFDNYLEQLKIIMKKVKGHNDIKIGITKLLIKYVSHKLDIVDLEKINNKKMIIEYFYNKYILEGYFYYSVPSIYINDILQNGLTINNYHDSFKNLMEINDILNKYGVEDIFFVDSIKNKGIFVTDSFFMSYFYATSTPIYLRDLCVNINKDKEINNAYILKDYNSCKQSIIKFVKKYQINETDKTKILDFFESEWNNLDVNHLVPIVVLIKRKFLNGNNLLNYNEIIERSENISIEDSIIRLFETRYNEIELTQNILSNNLTILQLPNLKDFISITEKKDELVKNNNEKKPVINEVGNATIFALIGIFLITLGVIIMLVMLWR